MLSVIDTIKTYESELVELRRDIHRHPETAFEEHRTAHLVAETLEAWGIEVHRGLATTGVVGTIVGQGGPGRTLGLRADLDALNIQENIECSHRSVFEGKMHACGHDGHTAMLLGAARYFAEHRDFPGTLHFIFQPAEEGLGGGRVMVAEGLFELFPCDSVYGMHNMPGIPAGDFAIREGSMMAASDTWTVAFSGTGGHGSMPCVATDPTLAAAQFITTLQTIVSRNVAPQDSAVLSVGYLQGGHVDAANVIPSQVLVRGTARSFLPATRDLLERRLAEIAHAIAAAHNCIAAPEYARRYPPVVNSRLETAVAIRAAQATVGNGRVNESTQRLTGGEDFSFMLERTPGAYILIGNGCDEDYTHNVHTPAYDFNDGILVLGAAYWVNLVKIANQVKSE